MNTERKNAVTAPRVSIVCNGALSVLKLAAGSLFGSAALVSDAVHSAADVFGDLIVLIGMKLSAEHKHEAERYEKTAALLLAVFLFVTGAFIGFSSLKLLLSVGETAPDPGLPALLAAALSVVVKELLFRYTRNCAVRLNSGAVMAEAMHHRADAMASLGTLLSTLGTKLGYTWLDPAASLVICALIWKTAWETARNAGRKRNE